jgi:hypothetical protein
VNVVQILCNHQKKCVKIITGNESWICGYDVETKEQNLLMEKSKIIKMKEARQVMSKVKSMLIIFFDINGAVHKDFILAGQTVFLILP